MAEGEVRYNWDGSKIESIGGETVRYNWDGSKIESIGGETVRYNWNDSKIESIGGETVRYNWDDSKIESIGGRSVHYNWNGEKIESIAEKTKESTYSWSGSDSSYSYGDSSSYSSYAGSVSPGYSGDSSQSQAVLWTIGIVVSLVLCAILAVSGIRGTPAQPTQSPPTLGPPKLVVATFSSVQEHQFLNTPEPGSNTRFPAGANTNAFTGVVRVDSTLNLRAFASTSAKSIAKLKNGTRFEILGRNGDGSWLYVNVPSIGKVGWVSAEYAALEISVMQIPTVQHTSQPPKTPLPKDTLTTVPRNTATPPVPGGIELTFAADQESIQRGQCTIIRWGIGNVKAIYLDGQGLQGGYAEKRVCPKATTTYTMRIVLRDGTELDRKVVVRVQ